MENVFDPARHKVVAVDAKGQHIHVELGELKADMAALETAPVVVETVQQPLPSNDGKLALAVSLAAYAIQNGVQAGDLRWHGGPVPFEWGGKHYDAPGIIEYARSQL